MIEHDADGDRSEEHPARASFGSHIKQLRRARALTQAQLGQRCGLSGDTIRRIEAGGISPTLDTILKLAHGLDLLPSTLFESFELSEEIGSGELFDLLATRSPSEIRLAMNVMRAIFAELDGLARDHRRSAHEGNARG